MKIKVDETFIFEEKSKSFFGFLNRKITQVNIDDETRIVDLKKYILKKYGLDAYSYLFRIVQGDKEIEDDVKIIQLNTKKEFRILCKNKNELFEILRKIGKI